MIIRKINSGLVFPIKYEKVEYNYEFSSLRNTGLSIGKLSITGAIDIIKPLTCRKNRHPSLSRAAVSYWLTVRVSVAGFGSSRYTTPINTEMKIV